MTLELQTKSRRRFTCNRHPAELVTGFCALCLRERLAGLESPGGSGTSASAAAISSLQPELRRCKSYAARKCGASSGDLEQRRNSCEVRGRNTLWHLFSVDDEENGLNGGIEVESKNLGFLGVTHSVFESRGQVKSGDNIRVYEDSVGQNVNDSEQKVEEAEEEPKTMKEHIELEWQSRKQTGKDLKDIAGSFWLAASVFSQKLRNWRLKQRMKKRRGGVGSRSGGGESLPPEKLNSRHLRETQSEVGDYGHGRRSCDTDPRFSLDVRRISLDDSRFSFDEPRASWDGYMIAMTIPRLAPMLSVIENAMIPPVNRSLNGMPIEDQMNTINENGTTSGESAHTKDYCSDSSSSQRQTSFDCSSSGKSSNKKTEAAEIGEIKSMSNFKPSPTPIGVVNEMNFVVTDRDTRHSDFNSHKPERSECIESALKNANSVAGGSNSNGYKKSGKWRKVLNILGFINRPNVTKFTEVEGNDIGTTTGDCSKMLN